jgi:hypothetical protein
MYVVILINTITFETKSILRVDTKDTVVFIKPIGFTLNYTVSRYICINFNMELAIFTLLLLSNIGYCLSFDAQNISKIICSLSKSSHVDIFKQELVDAIKLSKDCFKNAILESELCLMSVTMRNMISFCLYLNNKIRRHD